MSNFLSKISKQVLIGDGAMGTMLVKEGLPAGYIPELWMLSNPDIVKNIHKKYIESGSDVIGTNTFGANSLKLQEYQASAKVEEINFTAAKIAKEAAQNKAFVAGVVGPTGQFPEPLGKIPWLELKMIFKEQVIALEAGGADFIFMETFSDLGELRAALSAAKEYTNLPVACSMTYSKGRTLTGTNPEVAAVVLAAMGADIIGANCSTGPEELLEIMSQYRTATHLPLLVEPNAGMPLYIEGETVYNQAPEIMASFVEKFREIGVNLIGACCGSTPQHIKAMKESLTSHQPQFNIPKSSDFPTRLASRSKVISLGKNLMPIIIGERLNPTARKAIAQAYRDKNWNFITKEGFSQSEAGAQVLDLNVGVPGEDEGQLLKKGVHELEMSLDTPLVLDCTKPQALEKGLQEYHGKTLINSVNGEEKSLQTILPLAKKYGAAVLGLTLDENGIPEKAEERFAIAEKIVNRALSLGLCKEDIVIDCLVLTAATSPALAMETVKAISLVKRKLGVSTVLGLSNVSHGLPQRSMLNASFLALAIGAGLDAAIANPLDKRIHEVITSTALLTSRDPGAKNYIAQSSAINIDNEITKTTSKPEQNTLDSLRQLIQNGQKESIVEVVKTLLEKHSSIDIIDKSIVPALENIGDEFAKGTAFLPQLIMSGDAAQNAFSYIKNQLPENSLESKGTIVLGTVKGDVHDIGKNIVSALLENHGYNVIDLGKNVSAEDFAQSAINEDAQIVGLSALMTTTMVEMAPIIKVIKAKKPDVKVIVGGAVVTKDFADSINADGYGKDAVEAVKLVQSFLG